MISWREIKGQVRGRWVGSLALGSGRTGRLAWGSRRGEEQAGPGRRVHYTVTWDYAKTSWGLG